jgi:hypothetical protein
VAGSVIAAAAAGWRQSHSLCAGSRADRFLDLGMRGGVLVLRGELLFDDAVHCSSLRSIQARASRPSARRRPKSARSGVAFDAELTGVIAIGSEMAESEFRLRRFQAMNQQRRQPVVERTRLRAIGVIESGSLRAESSQKGGLICRWPHGRFSFVSN